VRLLVAESTTMRSAFVALVLIAATTTTAANAFLSMNLYGVPDSGWTSPRWNWGSAVGTGHDCAQICRSRYNNSRRARQELVDTLQAGGNSATEIDFEEVKLVLALAWQRGRWDGSDGGRGGYGEVLQQMANAQRYEVGGSAQECSRRLVQDMQERYHLLDPSDEQLRAMKSLDCSDGNIFTARCCCAGLVLEAMGFVENGC